VVSGKEPHLITVIGDYNLVLVTALFSRLQKASSRATLSMRMLLRSARRSTASNSIPQFGFKLIFTAAALPTYKWSSVERGKHQS
jgi:hypothetical protein